MNKKVNHIGLLIQFILVCAVIILFVLQLFIEPLKLFFSILLGLTLFVLAYNNHEIYKRKYFTLIYLIFGIIVIVSGVINGI